MARAEADRGGGDCCLDGLFYTAVRVSELASIRVGDVDHMQCKIIINQSKGSRDRYILFPESFRLVLSSYLQA